MPDVNVGTLYIGVKADNKNADKQLKSTEKLVDKIEGKHTAKVDANVSAAEKGLKTVSSLLKGIGFVGGIAVIKKTIDIGIDFATAANDKQQTIEKAKAMVGDAYGEVAAYAQKLNQKYGLNETNTISMMTDFAGAYKGMGLDNGTAMQYAERMSNAALDYAAALNKTPAEVESIMMSLMRGNTSVADNLSLYGVTADSLKKTATQLKEKGLMPEGIDESAQKYVALMNRIEENAKSLGFAGAYEREVDTFGSQSAILADEWKTLKENVGTYLLPIATDLVTGFNGILNGITGFIDEISGKNAKAAIEEALGMNDKSSLSSTEITTMVNGWLAPFTELNTQLEAERQTIDAAATNFGTSAKNLNKSLLQFYQGNEAYSGENILTAFGDTAKTDELWQMVDEYEAGITRLLQVQSDAAVEDYLSFWGMGNDIDTEAVNVTTAIRDYYDGMIDTVSTKMQELRTVLNTGMENGGLTQEDLTTAQQLMTDITQLGAANASVSVTEQLRQLQYSGQWSTQTLAETSAYASQLVDEAFMAQEAAALEAATQVRKAIMAGDDTGGYATKEEYANAVSDRLWAGFYGQKQDAYGTALDQIAKMYMANNSYGSAESAFVDLAIAKGTTGMNSKAMQDEWYKNIVEPMAALEPVVTQLRELEGKGYEVSADAQAMLETYDRIMGYGGDYNAWIMDTGVYQTAQDNENAAREAGFAEVGNDWMNFLMDNVEMEEAAAVSFEAPAEEMKQGAEEFTEAVSSFQSAVSTFSGMSFGGSGNMTQNWFGDGSAQRFIMGLMRP